jgi:trehalose synthase
LAFRVEIPDTPTLSDYASVAHLVAPVGELEQEARAVAPKLEGRTIWMVNSTPQGGGVAEMLPTMVSLLRDLGIQTEWAVIESDEAEFFALTKQIHNLIHGEGTPELGPRQRELFEHVNAENAAFFRSHLAPGDILIVHDPQPMPLAGMLKDELDLHTIWRCHIGLDRTTPASNAAWRFLMPYASDYECAVFSAPEYIPGMLTDRAHVIFPGINPITEKNRELGLHKTVGILANSGLSVAPGPLVTPPYAHCAQRLLGDGEFHPANVNGDFGLFTRPIVTQVSRWDRLKGFEPLLRAFASFKTGIFEGNGSSDPMQASRQDLVRMVLAGPDPSSIQDDPEGQEVLAELKRAYCGLEPRIQECIAFIALPMESAQENAFMVNALQRASTIVVQNSLREGFGLTVTEAMWKRVPILTNDQACGPRHQVRDTIDGRLVGDPTDSESLAGVLDAMLADADARIRWGRNAQRHVHERFLIFSQLREWMRIFAQRF